ncbi:MAG: ATP-binding protein, partial [Candidatus Methanomethyliaceae archaeon]|nr:ATP-binding protein [Candidatus Methanomethyliaceae archaeon]
MELIVGKIEGVTTTDFFTMVITNPCIGKEDYVEVEHEGRKYLLIVKEIRRFGDKLLADCIIIGTSPKIPFNTGLEVKLASEETIRRGLGLTAKEADGIYIGKLRDLMIWLPVRKLTRIFIVGKPGAGKPYTMGVIAEELMKKGVPLVIVDAHGEYSSLKVPAESPSEEFKVEPRSYADYIIEFANLTFNPGADIDISALESMRIEDLVSQMQCTIINLRGLPLLEQYYIVSKLLNRLLEAIMIMQIPPFYLVLDEAHIFAGRGKQKDPLIKECSEVVRRFVQEGRKFGANLIVLTQRPQLLDMTVRSLSATWIIHQLTDPNDVKIAIESGGLSKEWSDKINWLEPGEAIITGDVVERIPLHIKIRRRETRHGAPGFNPLDFVSPEERERMKKRLSSMKTRLIKIQAIQEGPPSLALPSLYLPIAIDEEKILSKLKDNRTLDHVELIKHNLKYMPSLFAEAMVSTFKRIPSIEIKDRIRRIIPVDSSITTFDWRYESAYGLTIEDVTNPLSTPQREGK